MKFVLLFFLVRSTCCYETTFTAEQFKYSSYNSLKFVELSCLHIRGSKLFYPLELLGEVNYSNPSEVSFLKVSLVEISPFQFMKSLHSFPNLHKLDMENVIWKGDWNLSVTFPHLLSVDILLKDWKISNFTEFKSILHAFLNKDGQPPTHTRIRGEYGGSFEQASKCGSDENTISLETSELPFDVWHLQDDVGCLTLINSTLDLGLHHRGWGRLERLTARNVKFQSGTALDVLGRIEHISHFDFSQIPPKDGRMSAFDFSHFPKLLFDVRLEYAHAFTSGPTHLPELGHLILANSKVDLSRDIWMKSNYMRNIVLLNNGLNETQLEFLCPPPIGLKYLMVHEKHGTRLTFDPSCNNTQKTLEGLSLENFRISFPTENEAPVFRRLQFLRIINFELTPESLRILPKVSTMLQTIEIDHNIDIDILNQLRNTTASRIVFTDVFNMQDRNVLNYLYNSARVPPSQYQTTIERYKQDMNWSYKGKQDNEMGQSENAIFYTYVIIVGTISMFGIMGNLVNILVLSAKKNLDSTSCILIGLAIYDILLLVSFLLCITLYAFIIVTLFLDSFKFPSVEPQLEYFYHVTPDYFKSRILASKSIRWSSYIPALGVEPLKAISRVEDFQASFLYPLGKAAYTGSVYTTILITLERYVAVCWSLWAKSLLSMKKSLCACAIVLAFAISLNIPRLFETSGSILEVVDRGGDKLELVRIYLEKHILEYEIYRTYFHGYAWSIAMFLIPIPLITFLNIKIWMKVARAFRDRRSMTSSASKEEGVGITLMLLVVSTLFVACNSINGLITLFLVTVGRFDPRDAEVWSCLPIVINSSANFIVYCLLGKRFRSELKRRLKMIAPCFFSGGKRKIQKQRDRKTTGTQLTDM